MEYDLQARLLAARLSLTASLPWMPPPDTRTRQEAAGVVPSDTMPVLDDLPGVYDSAGRAVEARQRLEDELVARAEEMLAEPVPQDQPWAEIGLTLLIIMVLLGGDDEGAAGLAGWLPRWRRAHPDRPEGPAPRELAEALRGMLSSRATAVFNGRQLVAIEEAARRDPRVRMMWHSRHDDRVRGSHRVADGQVQPVGGWFRVGVALLPYPGWPAGPPEEVFGCRCVLLPTRQQ